MHVRDLKISTSSQRQLKAESHALYLSKSCIDTYFISMCEALGRDFHSFFFPSLKCVSNPPHLIHVSLAP